MGHEELSLPLKLSGRCGSGKRPLAVKDQESSHPTAWHLSMRAGGRSIGRYVRLFGNSIPRRIAHPAVQHDASEGQPAQRAIGSASRQARRRAPADSRIA